MNKVLKEQSAGGEGRVQGEGEFQLQRHEECFIEKAMF